MNNYFAIERGGKCLDNMCIADDSGNIMFEDVMSMSYEDLKAYEHLESFVDCIMSVSDKSFDIDSSQTVVTLVGDDDVFIWSVIMAKDGNDSIRYVLVDWKKDGKQYRYQKD